MSSIAVVFGGPSPEHDISVLTGLQAARSLASGGADVTCIYWTKRAEWLRVPTGLEAEAFLEPEIPNATPLELAIPGGFLERRRLRHVPLEIDVVLNSCHGGPGEDGVLSGLLLLAGLHVSGPHPEVCGLVMDKYATAAVAAMAGIPTIESVVLCDELDDVPLSRPWVVKPRYGGSSIGVEANVGDLVTVRALAGSGPTRRDVVIQPYHEGWVDLHIAFRNYPEPGLSAIERPLRNGDALYTYASKYLQGREGMESAERELPAILPEHVEKQLREYTLKLASVIKFTGAPRVDFLWDGGDALVLCEINAIPGAWGAYLWSEVGVSRTQLLRDLLDEAKALPVRRPQWSGSSDGTALRVAGSIASKLS